MTNLESSFLFFLWLIGGGSAKLRQHEFEDAGNARELFRKVNEAHGRPLRLVAERQMVIGQITMSPRRGLPNCHIAISLARVTFRSKDGSATRGR